MKRNWGLRLGKLLGAKFKAGADGGFNVVGSHGVFIENADDAVMRKVLTGEIERGDDDNWNFGGVRIGGEFVQKSEAVGSSQKNVKQNQVRQTSFDGGHGGDAFVKNGDVVGFGLG